jgi:hypothetical protein
MTSPFLFKELHPHSGVLSVYAREKKLFSLKPPFTG